MDDYGQRWRIAFDTNGDGAYTLADLGRWLEYIFFAPGDAMIWVASQVPGLAASLGLSPATYSGWGSGFASFAVWGLILWSFDQRSGDEDAKPPRPAP